MPLASRGAEHDLRGELAVEEEIMESGGERAPVVRASRPIQYNGETVGFAVLRVLDTFTNLPFLTATDPYSRAFRGGRRELIQQPAGRGFHSARVFGFRVGGDFQAHGGFNAKMFLDIEAGDGGPGRRI